MTTTTTPFSTFDNRRIAPFTSASALGGKPKQEEGECRENDSEEPGSCSNSEGRAMGNDYDDDDDGNFIIFHHVDATGSTQDEAKRILNEEGTIFPPPAEKTDERDDEGSSPCCLAVTATEQNSGRGTKGRDWISHRGNVFLTVVVPKDDLSVPLTLLPLQVGTVVATCIGQHLKDCGADSSKVTLKWPNDVLVNGDKIAGVLIEPVFGEKDWFLIGIGINVGVTPQVETKGPNYGRKATSISEYCSLKDDDDSVAMALTLARRVARQIAKWVNTQKTPDDGRSGVWHQQQETQRVIRDWKLWVEWNVPVKVRDTEEIVIPVDVESDGRLVVLGAETRDDKMPRKDEEGAALTRRHLVADYLF